MTQIARLAENHIVESLKNFPAVYLAGPRQAGKTTLTNQIATSRHQAQYLTFDDLQLRSAVSVDPDAFLHSLKTNVVLDEIQLAPELFRPLKIIIDENRQLANGGRGKFLLTGSASVMALPQLSDALVGRMALYTLYPFSVKEIISNKTPTFIDALFSQEWQFAKLTNDDITTMMTHASYPELYTLDNPRLCYEWCNSYINTILQRDVRVLLEVEKIAALPNLLKLLASRTGGLLNEASLSRETGLNHATIKRYRLLLESLFLIQSIPAWSRNLGNRLIKAPKIYISDLNILAYLLNIDIKQTSHQNPMLFGAMLENFVAIELSKQISFSNTHAKLYHYRKASGQEIDFIIEGQQNQIVAIEVKAKSKVTSKDFQHLQTLQTELENEFYRGIVLYQGTELLPFGKDLWAVPVSMLWQ